MLTFDREKRSIMRLENQRIILGTMARFLADLPITDEGTTEKQVDLIDGRYIFRYTTDGFYYSLRNIKTEIIDPKHPSGSAVTREYFMNVFAGKMAIIRSDSKTTIQYQSRGLGAGLLLASDFVIVDAMNRYKEFNRVSAIVAEIVDGAKGKGTREDGLEIQRDGWTSTYAQQLGYEYIGNTEDGNKRWQKVYR